MKNWLKNLFLLALLAAFGTKTIFAIAPATKIDITLKNNGSSTYSLSVNTSLDYYVPHPPDPLPSQSSYYHFIYDTTKTLAAPGASSDPSLWPSMTYTSKTNPDTKWCKFEFTGSSDTGCTVSFESPPPSKMQATPQLCDAKWISYDQNTNICYVQFTIY